VRIKDRHIRQLFGLQASSNVVLAVSMLLLAGCVAGFPVHTDKPSNHFDTKYIEAHQGSTKQEVLQQLGDPDTILQSKGKTYYVYDATGDTRMVVGAVFVVPPFFVPFWTPKDKGGALHCLALVFDEKGQLQDYIAKTASEPAGVGLVTFYGAAGVPIGEKVTGCVKTLWNYEERQSLELLYPRNISDEAKWFCPQADDGIADPQRRIGDLLYYGYGETPNRDLVRAYVWYSLAAKGCNSEAQIRLLALEKQLTDEELQDARRRLDAWKPGHGQCMKDLTEAGLIK
jgi:hypothetical protein